MTLRIRSLGSRRQNLLSKGLHPNDEVHFLLYRYKAVPLADIYRLVCMKVCCSLSFLKMCFFFTMDCFNPPVYTLSLLFSFFPFHYLEKILRKRHVESLITSMVYSPTMLNFEWDLSSC